MKTRHHSWPQTARGFTLVEMMVSTVVLALLLIVIVSAMDSVQRSWRRSREKVDQFRSARAAFETITRQLTQATLNTYWDYHYAETGSNAPPVETATPPSAYVRQSELHFITGQASELIGDTVTRPVSGHALFFQAPLGHSSQFRGLGSLLNGRGFYVQWRSNESTRPDFLPSGVSPVKERYQLMEYRPISEQATVDGRALRGNSIYTNPDGWFKEDLELQSRAVASNILALFISPRTAQTEEGSEPWWIAPSYRYDSRDTDNSTAALDKLVITEGGVVRQGTQHLLPPLVRVTLIASDEESFARWLELNPEAGGKILERAGAPFAAAGQHDQDLVALKQYLDGEHLNYRVFSQSMPLRNAAWDSRLAANP